MSLNDSPRSLSDLKLNKAPEGSLAVSACAVNDLFGWLLFTVVMAIATGDQVAPSELVTTFLATLGFVALCIGLGSRVIAGAASLVKRMSSAGSSLRSRTNTVPAAAEPPRRTLRPGRTAACDLLPGPAAG